MYKCSEGKLQSTERIYSRDGLEEVIFELRSEEQQELTSESGRDGKNAIERRNNMFEGPNEERNMEYVKKGRQDDYSLMIRRKMAEVWQTWGEVQIMQRCVSFWSSV